MATCPTCKDAGMQHTLISGSLPALSCPDCKGMLVSLVTYRDWRERRGVNRHTQGEGRHDSLVSDTRDVISCCKCSRLMTKYRVSAEMPNRIDFCANCEDVWLDAGEWELIEALAGTDQLANITAQPWQHRITAETVTRMEAERLEKVLGDDLDKVRDLEQWLRDHPSRLTILAYLTDRSR